jgi:competence protein ComEC
MDPGLREAYSAAGLTHILAVSGMHVALIFGFLSFLLGFLKNLPSGRFLFAAALIALLWFYALVTGLSPSVLRAVTLFSVMQAGGVLRKPSLPLNNLCFASLILLLADETILFDLGYQLSFSAVYGIIAFQPVMAGWMQARTKTGKFIWENLCVTLAASLSTLPLILFHFHRFPLYFLISNLFAVPFSNLIIYTGIALLTASWLPLAAKFIASILHGAIALLNAFVSGINALPFSSTGNIYLSMTDFVLLLLAVVTLQLFLISKKNLHLNFLLSIVLLIFLAQLRGWCTARNQRQMFVLKHRKDWFFLETQQSHGRLSSLHPQDMPRFLEKGLKLKKMHYDTLMSRIVCRENGRESRIYSFHGKSILLLNHFLKFLPPECRLPTDFMLLEHAGEKSLLQALKFFKPMRILTDWPESRIKKFCMQNPGIPPITSLQEQKIIPIQW